MALEPYLREFTSRDWEADVGVDPIRFAIVGAGWWARTEAIPAIAESDYCEAAVVTDRSAEHVATATEGTDIRGLDPDEFRDGVAADAYDAVYVATPNATHPEYTEAAADLGKAVLCEKPMAATVRGAERMVEACDAAGVPLMVAYRVQTDPTVRRAKDLVQGGLVGDVVHVHGHMSDHLLEFIDDPDQWRLDPEVSGGGTMSDIALYPLNTTRFVLEDDPEAVYASVESEHGAFADVDEHASFQVEFPGTTTAVCTVSHNAHQSSSLTFHGSKGRVTVREPFFPWDPRELVVDHAGVDGEVVPEQANQLVEEFDYFGNCLQRGVDPYADGRHGLVDVRTIEALYDSAERGERIPL